MRSSLGNGTRTRIGIVGFGFIGSGLARWIEAHPDLDLAFVYNRDPSPLTDFPVKTVAPSLDQVDRFRADIIVEAAHPDITRAYGASFLRQSDYLPLSVTALADDALHEELRVVAVANNHRLLIPHGALVGLDSLLEWREEWCEVTVSFRKHPDNIDFSNAPATRQSISRPTVLFDGSAREIAGLYPRNVNTMVSCALATVGLDQMRAVLIADPALDKAVAEVEATGKDGSHLITRREQPASGVSGTEMFNSLARSLLHATGAYEPVDFL